MKMRKLSQYKVLKTKYKLSSIQKRKNKLKIRLLSMKEKTFTIDFTKDEFRVLKILSNQYLIKKNLKKPKSNINNDFDKYLDKKNK